MTKLSPHSLLFSLLLEDGRFHAPSPFPKIWSLSRKKYHNWRKKLIASLKRKRRKKRKPTEKAIQALIIGLVLALVLLAGCNYKMVPSETKIEYGTTETDSKNNKLQQKQSITQTWKWKQQ